MGGIFGVSVFLKVVLRGSVWRLWVAEECLGVPGGCLGGVWRLCRRCLGVVYAVFGLCEGCLDGCLMNVLGASESCIKWMSGGVTYYFKQSL